jgi:hypothetical protein
MGSSFIVDKTSWDGMGVVKIFYTSDAFPSNIQKDDCHNKRLARLLDSRLWDLTIKSKSFMLLRSPNWN